MLALDGSKISDSLVDEVIKLTKDQSSNVRIIHVVDESCMRYGGPSFDYLSIVAAWKEDGEKILDNAAKKIAQQTSIKPETSILELKPFHGRVAEVIVDAAKEWPADLLIIGTHGRHGFSRLFLGSVAENVVRIATTPVLLLRSTDV